MNSTKMIARDVAYVLMFVIASSLAVPAAAQAQDGTLDRVQNLITTGRYTDAGTTLERWEREYSDATSAASPADRARAIYLRGLLTTDMAQAEELFMSVVLTYPSSAVAPDALLRLGQGLHTNGETQRAIAYLERLRSDYPGSAARPTGMLWLARAQLANGSAAAACETARTGAGTTADPNLQLLLDIEQDRACGAGAAQTRVVPPTSTIERSAGVSTTTIPPVTSGTPPASAGTPPATSGTPPTAAGTPPARSAEEPPRTWQTTAVAEAPPVDRSGSTVTPPVARGEISTAGAAASSPTAVALPDSTMPAPAGDFSVQVAAFREFRSARVIAGQMRDAGVDVRIVTLRGDDGIYRIRSGSFATAREAAAAMQHVRDAGFAALLVNDVRDERLVRDPAGL